MNQETKKIDINEAVSIFGSHFVLSFKNYRFSIKEKIGLIDEKNYWKDQFKTLTDAKIEYLKRNITYLNKEINKFEVLNNNIFIKFINFLGKKNIYKNEKLSKILLRQETLKKYLSTPETPLVIFLYNEISVPKYILDIEKEYYFVNLSPENILSKGLIISKLKVVDKKIFINEDFNSNTSFDLENEDGSVSLYVSNDILHTYDNSRYDIGGGKYLYTKEDNIKSDMIKKLEVSKNIYLSKINSINNILKEV